ncbi:MAG: nickel-dependent hydrogenase large subunit [Syntrophobacteraceae bacterium]
MALATIPFGPQHPVLPEPVHLKLRVEDEVIREAVPALGYVHRGLEKLAEVRDFHQMIQIVERVCGICSMMHAMCYCHCIESMMGIEAPPRATFLRVIWAELHRIHSHLLWLGLFADSFGFESLFMQIWKIREKIMDLQEATAGNRVIVSVNIIGGLRKDLDREQIRSILTTLSEVEEEMKRLDRPLLDDYTVKKRTREKGVLSAARAQELGCVGPTLRGSGVAKDMRLSGYAAYRELSFEPVVEKEGDCHARCRVRYREVFQSIALIREAAARLPEGEISAPAKGRPEGESTARVEQPRGEVFYYVRADGGKYLQRVRIRTPTFANLPALVTMLPGMYLSDVPVIVLSIDPCISCTER